MTSELMLSLCTLLRDKVELRPSLSKQLPSFFIPVTEWGLYCHHLCVHSASTYVTRHHLSKHCLCHNTELDTFLLLFGFLLSSYIYFFLFIFIIFFHTVLHFIFLVLQMGSVMAMWYLKGRISTAFSSSCQYFCWSVTQRYTF